MLSNILDGLSGLTDGVAFLFTLGGLKNVIMLVDWRDADLSRREEGR